jgi:hypothetical protein
VRNGGGGQDARAPGGVVGIERAGKVDAALGGGAFAGDHAIAYDGQGMGGSLAAGRLQGDHDIGRLDTRGRHSETSQFLISVQHFHAGVNEWLPIRNRRFDICRWLPIGRCDSHHGSRLLADRTAEMGTIKGNSTAIRGVAGVMGFFAAGGPIKRSCSGFRHKRE